MKIVFLIDRMWGANGGTEGQLLMLLKYIDRSRFEPRLICLRETDWLRTAQLPCPVELLHVGSLLRPSFFFSAKHFSEYLVNNKVDLVQTYFDDAFIFGAIAGKLAKVPVISARRNLGPAFWGKRGYLWTFRMIERLTSLYLVNSQATRDAIATSERIPPDKIKVIPNGLALDRFTTITPEFRMEQRQKLGVSDRQLLVGMVSHLRREKNLELFVDAAESLRVQFPEARWVLIGDGWYRDIIEKYIEARNLKDIIRLPGAVPDVVPYLAAIDIGVLTSDGESFSNAIIEYQAAGLPVVATSVGGTVEAVQGNGFLFPPGDLNGLVAQLTTLLQNQGLREAMGQNSRLEAHQKYSITRMVAAHEEIYSTYLPSLVH